MNENNLTLEEILAATLNSFPEGTTFDYTLPEKLGYHLEEAHDFFIESQVNFDFDHYSFRDSEALFQFFNKVITRRSNFMEHSFSPLEKYSITSKTKEYSKSAVKKMPLKEFQYLENVGKKISPLS